MKISEKFDKFPIKQEIEQILKAYDGEDKVISSFEMRELITKQKKNRVKLITSLNTLSQLIDGFTGGELVTIAGKTGCGKTMLAQTFTKDFDTQGNACLWFSYELMPEDFLARFEKLPLFYMPEKITENALEWIRARIYEAQLKYDIKAVFIDNLHFLIDLAVMQNASLQIGQIVRILKRMALKYNIVIFLISHVEKIKEDKPSIDEIRDSGMIPAESDTVLIVWREVPKDEKKGEISGITVEKSRRIGTWKKKVKIEKVGSYFEEI